MRILVTGASGTVGSEVVPRLLERGAAVRALSRDPANRVFPEGVEPVAGDLDRPESLEGAFDGVEAVMLYPHPETAEEVVARIRAAGARRIVLMSSASVETAPEADTSDNFGHQHHRPVEEAVERSGLEWTHLRGGEFMVNDLDSYPDSVRAEGVIRAPHGDNPGVPVHEADMADMAVAALLEDGHHGRAYEVTGPEHITPAERAAVISQALGRAITFEHLTTAQAREMWLSQGVPPEICDWLLWEPDPEDSTEWAADEFVSKDYEQVIGRPGRTYAQWVADHLDAFR
ncbi:NAD(P)H-binding protein [Nocardiopsis exhalans]|uniref:NAD(P)H-binding protein n=1 Tax=Nocardiopsis exhalans TaxID=163604 RepID=A0ABY5DHQ8_9ACTN|nr:NAD(P)H-binding protein [Nocardiopsis exhalans]USY22930.1 NAD(P)H-binding protein [Nocardiopsis exhalans]